MDRAVRADIGVRHIKVKCVLCAVKCDNTQMK